MKLSALVIAALVALSCAHVQPVEQEAIVCAKENISPIVAQFMGDLASMGWEAAVTRDVLRYGEATAACVFAYIEQQKSAKPGDDVLRARAREFASKLHYRAQ